MPLNQLQSVHSDLYTEAFKKYSGREHLTQFKLPLLNCLWNDVIHFCPVHPSIIRKELNAISPTLSKDRPWLQIPAESLANLPAIYYRNAPSVYGGVYNFPESCFSPFLASKYEELNALPEWTIEYYREQFKKSQRPLLFNGVPHILVQAHVPLADMTEISW